VYSADAEPIEAGLESAVTVDSASQLPAGSGADTAYQVVRLSSS